MLLAEEMTNATHPGTQLPPTSTSSLLATGEVSDLRDVASMGKAHPILAFASGESGHILRFISLLKEEWSWESEDIRADLHKPNLGISGEWCQDSQPISLIKFAIDRTKFSPIRWLLVQKATMTAVCEPELKRIPTHTAGLSGDASSSAQLFANPLFSIRSDQTGGNAQTNVSFRANNDGHCPQLTIIDQAGHWSIWEITGRRAARPKVLRPIMKMRGNILTGPETGIAPKMPQLQEQHGILWLSLDRSALNVRDGSRSPSARSDELEAERPRLLLMCNSTVIHLFDVDMGRFLDATQKFVLYRPQTGTQKVLSMKPSPLDSSQAFILTTTILFLVATKETSDGKLSLDVLAACPHRRDSTDPALRLDVSPTAYLNRQRTCFVCVRSPKDAQMTVSWFINPEPGMPLQYHNEMVSLKDPPKFSSMGMLPVARRAGVEANTEGLDFLKKSNAKFFQLLALGDDLSLSSALCAWSDKPGVRVSAPDRLIRKRNKLRRRERLKFLHTMESAFVVPDGYDERPWFAEAKDRGEEPVTDAEISEPAVQRITNFEILGGRMATGEGNISDDEENPEHGFISHAIQKETRDGVMPRHSLLDLVGPRRSVEVLLRVASEWKNRQHEMMEEHGVLHPPPSGIRISGSELDDLVARLEDIFMEPLAVKDQHVRESLQRMAAEIYLSEIGIATKAGDKAATETTGDGDHLQVASQSSTDYRSSPPLLGLSQEEPDLPTLGRTENTDEEAPVSVHLREYAYMKPVTAAKGQTALQSHWDRGLEKGKIDWTPWKGEELDAAYIRKLKKAEKRRKKEEKLASRAHSDGPASMAMAESQPMPVIVVAASQPREAISFGQPSQMPMSTSQPVMSQIVPGAYGGRPHKKAKKKGKSGFR